MQIMGIITMFNYFVIYGNPMVCQHQAHHSATTVALGNADCLYSTRFYLYTAMGFEEYIEKNEELAKPVAERFPSLEREVFRRGQPVDIIFKHTPLVFLTLTVGYVAMYFSGRWILEADSQVMSIVSRGRGQRQSADLGDANSTELADAVAAQLIARHRRGDYRASVRHMLLKVFAFVFNSSMFVFMNMNVAPGNIWWGLSYAASQIDYADDPTDTIFPIKVLCFPLLRISTKSFGYPTLLCQLTANYANKVLYVALYYYLLLVTAVSIWSLLRFMVAVLSCRCRTYFYEVTMECHSRKARNICEMIDKRIGVDGYYVLRLLDRMASQRFAEMVLHRLHCFICETENEAA
ncbi:hypothetical protein QR680_012676 [Steinernema hermaphroditum]|uniref:Innexin n=1 Tax=Steinernema hermaphroditum TaxID=289476 RepID=A0AA39I2S0_9BILA|nr:hypothetical protein QR680_012676 [Steinernema hermaphroditum]